MVYAVKNTKKVSKREIDGAFKDLKFPDTDSAFFSQTLSYVPEKPSHFLMKSLKRAFGKPESDKDKYLLSTYKKDKYGSDYRARAAAMPSKVPESTFDESQANLAELHEEIDYLEEIEESKGQILAASVEVEKVAFRELEKNIEEIVKEKWRYLVMQFGGVFLTEIRPSKCFIGNKTLADMLITYEEKEKKYSLNLQLLENYLKENSNGKVQIHFSDIMFNPKIKDYELFSITSGDVRKANIFLELADFLLKYNKGKETIIPIHLPYYEKWKTAQEVREFGSLDENGERDALFKAEKVLRDLSKKWPNNNVKLALETGSGKSKRNGQIAYALLYDPFYFQTLTKGRKSFITICEDVGHLNLETAETNWKDYLVEEISEFHVSGNNGKIDEHTIATPETLKNYEEIMSFLKFYAGNICAEIGKGKLTAEEFVRGVKNLAYVLFSEPTKRDFENLKKIENYIVKITKGESKICEKNLNQERYGKYREHFASK